MFVFKGIFILLFLAANGVFSARLNDVSELNILFSDEIINL